MPTEIVVMCGNELLEPGCALHLTKGAEKVSTRQFFLGLPLAAVSCLSAPPCAPPTPAVHTLQALFTYENGLGRNKPKRVSFSVVTITDEVYFRQNNPPPNYDPNSRPVYKYSQDGIINTLNCPAALRG